jgi:hypothetical protein
VQTGSVEFTERLGDLEFQLENAGWVRYYDLYQTNEFSLTGLKTIARLARTFYLKNPLIQRGVDVSSDYVFGRGITITAKDEQLNEVIQAFIDDLKNQVELTAHQSMIAKDRELQLDGNVFFVFFINEITGRIRVRSLPFQEIEKIVCNPEDSKEPWYYVRKRLKLSNDELVNSEEQTDYYKDWQYQGTQGLPAGVTASNGVVFHLKMGGFSDWKFGVSEVYAALDWARAYKDFLQNWATLMQAYARFAMIINTKGGAAAVASAKTKFQTQLNPNLGVVDRNPPANTASTFISDRDLAALDVVKTAGATTKAEEGRRLLLMVAAAQGLPETFYGDVSVGTLATAESLDRPTELKFSNRQEFWQSNFTRIVWFVITNAVKALSGPLKGFASIEVNEYGEEQLVIPDDVDKSISIAFPEIINSSIKDHMSSIISGITLDGKTRVLLTPKMATEMILTGLGVDDVDEKLEALENEGVFDEPDPIAVAPVLPGVTPTRIPAKESVNLSAVIGRLIETMNKYE